MSSDAGFREVGFPVFTQIGLNRHVYMKIIMVLFLPYLFMYHPLTLYFTYSKVWLLKILHSVRVVYVSCMDLITNSSNFPVSSIQDCQDRGKIKQEDSFHQQTGFQFKEESSEMLYLEHSVVWCCTLDISESRSKIPGKFWNVVLERDGDVQLDRSCEKWRNIT
jgi:hypothetical protein